MDVGNLISGSSAFSKSSLSIWKFSIHILLKPSLENFKHVNFENFEHFASMWDECNCVVAWTFFGIAFLWDWNENWPFPVLWQLLFLSTPKVKKWRRLHGFIWTQSDSEISPFFTSIKKNEAKVPLHLFSTKYLESFCPSKQKSLKTLLSRAWISSPQTPLCPLTPTSLLHSFLPSIFWR